jgi:uncharacterized protein involved in exopolysaccharide biosynthesis
VNPNSRTDRIDLMDYLALLYGRRWILTLATLFAFALSVGLALLQKPIWISTSRLLPSESKGETSNLAGLAALAGLSVPQATSPETFYRDIILSNDFLDTLVAMSWKTSLNPADGQTLAQIYKVKVDSTEANWPERHRQGMLLFIRKRKLVGFERDPSGLMTLTCATIDPLLSYELNAFLLERLDTYNRVKKKSRTSEKKAVIEERLGDVEVSLKQSEERLRAFREKNLYVSTPALLLEQQRLLREVEVNGALYQELRKQYEITKIEVVDNTQFLNILEKPIVPTIAGKSNRRKLVMIVTLLGLFLASVAVLLQAKLAGMRNPVRPA